MTESTKKPDEAFSFERVGKRMPYAVPNDYFNQMELQIAQELGIKPRRQGRMLWLRRCAAAAAVVALVAMLGPLLRQQGKTDMADVEAAFMNLSEADRQYLISTYQSDCFIDEFQ